MAEPRQPTEADGVAYYEGIKRVFIKYFSVDGGDHIEVMTVQFMFHLFNAYPNVWSPTATEAEIRKMRHLFAELERTFIKLPFLIADLFDDDAIKLAGGSKENSFQSKNPNDKDGEAAFDFPTFAEAVANGLGESEFLELQRGFHQTIERALTMVPDGFVKGNKGLPSWEIVHACVEICREFPGRIKVPKAMNEAGPFYRLLVDMFELHGEESDPVAAFKGWRKHMVSTGQR